MLCGHAPHMKQGRRHDFGIGGAELEVGRKMCTRKFLTTPTST